MSTLRSLRKKMVAKTKPEMMRVINQNGLNAILYRSIQLAGGKISIPLSEICKVPKNAEFRTEYDEQTNSFEISIDAPEELIIAVPDRRIVV